MHYLLAFLFPPLAVYLAAGTGQAILNLLLTMLGYVPGLVHALVVVARSGQERSARPGASVRTRARV